jgi:hypothetical protein
VPVAVVTGMMATYPIGGVAWDYGQYLLGLQELGFDVFYLEDTGVDTYDPDRREYVEDASDAVRSLERTLRLLSPRLADRWHYRASDDRVFGVDRERLAGILAEADLLLNVSGGALLRDEYMVCPRKVLIDSDPGWNHFVNYPKWDASPGWQGTHGYRSHDYFFTYAEKIGDADCLLPALGIDWHPTRPVVICDRWHAQPPGQAWTTVMTWKNFRQTIEHDGRTFGTKEVEFDRIESLPQKTSATMEVAAGGSDPPLERWRERGWNVRDAHSVSRTPEEYREYIERSRGEFSVAKNVYVATRSGWFSCRSICYLAAGLPVIVQDTGFSDRIPTGEGLMAFTNEAEALAALEHVENDYPRHQLAARRMAEEWFSPRAVLTDLLQRIGLEAAP